MADVLTSLQSRVLYILKEQEKDRLKSDKCSAELETVAQLALVCGTDARNIYRVLESLENKKMISWKNHKFKNIKVLSKGNKYETKKETCVENNTENNLDKIKQDWVEPIVLFLALIAILSTAAFFLN